MEKIKLLYNNAKVNKLRIIASLLSGAGMMVCIIMLVEKGYIATNSELLLIEGFGISLFMLGVSLGLPHIKRDK